MVVEKFEKAQGKRMLSILLAVVMVLSTASVCLVSAAAKRESNLVSAQGDEEAFEESSTNYIESSTGSTDSDDSSTTGVGSTNPSEPAEESSTSPEGSLSVDSISWTFTSEGITDNKEYGFSDVFRYELYPLDGQFSTETWNVLEKKIARRGLDSADMRALLSSAVSSVGKNLNEINGLDILNFSAAMRRDVVIYCFAGLKALGVSTDEPEYDRENTRAFLYWMMRTYCSQLFVQLSCERNDALIIDEKNGALRPVPINEPTRTVRLTLRAKPWGVPISFDLMIFHIPGNELNGQMSETLSWKLLDGTLTISGKGEMTECIPYEFRPAIQKLVIEDGVTNVASDLCYDCQNLTSVTLSNSVQTIGSCAFEECTKLTKITIPSSVEEIGWAAFRDAGLQSIIIPDSVKVLEDYAFQNTVLTDITLPDSLEQIGQQCFGDTPYLKDESHWSDGVLYIGNNLIRAKRNVINGTYSIPFGTRCVAGCAFYNCDRLTKIDIPNTVYGIGLYAFYGCTGLKDLYIPNSVIRICSEAFAKCVNLETVSLNSQINVMESLFCGCKKLKKIDVPETVTMIAYMTFDDCMALEEITLPKSFKSVDRWAFGNCSNLKKVYYKGTEEDWSTVTIPDGTGWDNYNNLALLQAKKYFAATKVDASGVSVTYFPEEMDDNVELDVQEIDPQKAIGSFTLSENSTRVAFAAYNIRLNNPATGLVATPKGHAVTIHIPIAGDKVNQFDLEQYSYMVFHAQYDKPDKIETFSTTALNRAKPARLWKDNTTGQWFLILDVSSFSPFLVCVERIAPTVSIHNNPGTATLRFGETLVLMADAENLPDGAKLAWEADSDRVTLKSSADGKTCEVISKKNGTVTVTVKIVDTDGNPIEFDGKAISDSETIRSKATFFYKLIAFFKRLFGIVVHTTQTVNISPKGNS